MTALNHLKLPHFLITPPFLFPSRSSLLAKCLQGREQFHIKGGKLGLNSLCRCNTALRTELVFGGLIFISFSFPLPHPNEKKLEEFL